MAHQLLPIAICYGHRLSAKLTWLNGTSDLVTCSLSARFQDLMEGLQRTSVSDTLLRLVEERFLRVWGHFLRRLV